MNRWILTVVGIAAAGSAFAATTRPATPKAQGPKRVASVKASPTQTFTTAPVTPAAKPFPTTPAAAPADRPTEPVSPAPAPAPATAPPPAAEPVIVEERDVVIQREPNREGALTEEVEIVKDGKTGKVLSKTYVDAVNDFYATGVNFTTPPPLRKVISLDVKDATVREAIDAVIKQIGGGINVVYGKEAASDARITLNVKQVSASSLIGLITQNAGLNWSINVFGDKRPAELTISKGPRTLLPSTPNLRQSLNLGGEAGLLDVFVTPRAEANHLALRHVFAGEQRLSLECPHCKVKNTIIRQRSQPKCPKCTRTFQSDWQFCPADGTKRPADPNEWKFCPNCGKKVDVEKASIEGGIPFLSDLPVLGEFFRLPGAQNAAPVPLAEVPSPYAVPLPPLPGASPSYPKGPTTPVPALPGLTPRYPKGPVSPAPPLRAKPEAAPANPKAPLSPTPAAPPATPEPIPTAPVPSPDPAPEPATTPAK
jgi:hypothetical protein